MTGSVSEVKDYGLIVEIDDFEGVVGFVISHQITGKLKPQVGDKVGVGMGYLCLLETAEKRAQVM